MWQCASRMKKKKLHLMNLVEIHQMGPSKSAKWLEINMSLSGVQNHVQWKPKSVIKNGAGSPEASSTQSANERGRRVFDFFSVKLFKAHDVTVCLWQRVVGQTSHDNDHQQGTRVYSGWAAQCLLLGFQSHRFFSQVENLSAMHLFRNV